VGSIPHGDTLIRFQIFQKFRGQNEKMNISFEGDFTGIVEAVQTFLREAGAEPKETVVQHVLVDSEIRDAWKNGDVKEYKLTLVNDLPVACTCPNFVHTLNPMHSCKHMTHYRGPSQSYGGTD